MSRRGRFGPAVDRNNPEPIGICDRGGEIRHLRELMPQMRWAGNRLVDTGLLVCRQHMDIPNPQTGAVVHLGPDPVPVRNPRPPDTPPFYYEFNMTDAAGNELLDENGLLIAIPIVEPPELSSPPVEYALTDADGEVLLDENGDEIVQTVFQP